MIIQRVDPMSVAKISGLGYAAMGLLIGGFVALLSMAGLAGQAMGMRRSFGALFGVGAVILFPVLYGVLGAIASFVGAAIYNLLAGAVGGVRIDVE